MPRTETVIPLEELRRPRDTLGRPIRDLRISVMDRCNFRCPYCMPRETFHAKYRFLGSGERLSFEEIVRVARLFSVLGALSACPTPLALEGMCRQRRANGHSSRNPVMAAKPR